MHTGSKKKFARSKFTGKFEHNITSPPGRLESKSPDNWPSCLRNTHNRNNFASIFLRLFSVPVDKILFILLIEHNSTFGRVCVCVRCSCRPDLGAVTVSTLRRLFMISIFALISVCQTENGKEKLFFYSTVHTRFDRTYFFFVVATCYGCCCECAVVYSKSPLKWNKLCVSACSIANAFSVRLNRI